MIRKRHQTHHQAFSIVETVFSILVVSGVMVAALNGVGAAATTRQFADGRARGQLLAESLMTEIMAQAYQGEEGLAMMGLETGEAGASRVNFDDVDDYSNYTDSPPSLRNGELIEGFSNWTRTVLVQRADLQTPNTVPSSESGMKSIKISVRCNGVPVASLVAFKTCTDPVAGTTQSNPKEKEELEVVMDILDTIKGLD